MGVLFFLFPMEIYMHPRDCMCRCCKNMRAGYCELTRIDAQKLQLRWMSIQGFHQNRRPNVPLKVHALPRLRPIR